MFNKRRILIRFDDICPTMDFEQWGKALVILKKYNIKPLIGVIPDNRDPDLIIDSYDEDFWQEIKSLQDDGFAIGIHGLHHTWKSQVHGIVNKTIGSEFAGLSYVEQYNLVKEAKSIFEVHKIYTDIFIAPRHSYDLNTLRALRDNGFKFISDGKSRKPLYREGILCIPCRASGCPKIKRRGFYTALFHAHEWARPEKANGYIAFKNLCDSYHDDIVDFNTFIKRPVGNYFIQNIDEKVFLLFEYRIRPVLSFVKHKLLKL